MLRAALNDPDTYVVHRRADNVVQAEKTAARPEHREVCRALALPSSELDVLMRSTETRVLGKTLRRNLLIGTERLMYDAAAALERRIDPQQVPVLHDRFRGLLSEDSLAFWNETEARCGPNFNATAQMLLFVIRDSVHHGNAETDPFCGLLRPSEASQSARFTRDEFVREIVEIVRSNPEVDKVRLAGTGAYFPGIALGLRLALRNTGVEVVFSHGRVADCVAYATLEGFRLGVRDVVQLIEARL